RKEIAATGWHTLPARGSHLADLSPLHVPQSRHSRRQPHCGLTQMAGEIRIGAAQCSGVCREPASDDQTGDRGHTRSQRAGRAGRLNCPGTVEESAWISPGRGKYHRRKCRRPVKAGGIIDNPGNVVFEMQGIAPNEPAIASHLPDLAQKSLGKPLTTRPASEDQDVAAKKPGAGSKIDRGFAPQAGTVEQ